MNAPFGFQRFRRLQWKLTFFYIVTTIVVLIAIELLFVLVLYISNDYRKNQILAVQVSQVAENVGANFSGSFINRDKLEATLYEWPSEMGIEFQGYSAAVDRNGELIAAAGDPLPEGREWLGSLPEAVQQRMRAAVQEESSVSTYGEEDSVYVVAPLANQKEIYGVLVVKAEQFRFTFRQIWTYYFQFIGLSLGIFFIGAAVVGFAFGIVTSRSLVRRIRKILYSADRWSQGDFDTFVKDSSGDELGELAQRLNQMAMQLQQLLRERQDLATLEERNRLARDLHDSVKQQMFAVSIWVNTAKSMIGQDEQALRSHLTEAESLINETKQELSALIRELRPVALESKPFAHALEEYARTWQGQTGIRTSIEVHGRRPIPPSMEEAFFRITQEALSNAARHSGASLVSIRLECAEEATLVICDNGRGFDVSQANRQGIGLSSMRERVQAMGGQIDIRSERGQGTSITIRCKLPENHKNTEDADG